VGIESMEGKQMQEVDLDEDSLQSMLVGWQLRLDKLGHWERLVLDSKWEEQPYEGDDDDDELDDEDDDGDAEIQKFHQKRDCEPCLSSYSLMRLLPLV